MSYDQTDGVSLSLDATSRSDVVSTGMLRREKSISTTTVLSRHSSDDAKVSLGGRGGAVGRWWIRNKCSNPPSTVRHSVYVVRRR